jgi:hypothetical protein
MTFELAAAHPSTFLALANINFIVSSTFPNGSRALDG